MNEQIRTAIVEIIGIPATSISVRDGDIEVAHYIDDSELLDKTFEFAYALEGFFNFFGYGVTLGENDDSFDMLLEKHRI